MPAPKIILDLVARYRDNEEAYRRDYGETETRREFLDPFFKALGWDIDNTAGHAEAYKDVVHEDSVKVGFSMKAPDYSFRVGGVRKFFLEAKKPAVHIKEDSDPAFQLRRYAWSAKLPLSILSNFAEFAVYDCRARPAPADRPSKGRVMYLTCEDYAERWDEIAAILSKDAVYKGSFDKYAAGKGKRGTAEVDNAFLAEIEQWRDTLARNIALRNSGLAQPELNFAVQQTIDRIIFLRICEDRGIERYARLQALTNGENVYDRLKQLFHDADDRYNSGLFHFRAEKGRPHPDALTLHLKIDDKPLKDIFRGLYYPDSPYEFSVLPADILGQVYEQFLGKVIRLTAGGQAKVEDKPEVKKAGGVYYTPTYIVDYIVGQTVGKLLEGSTPDKAAKLKILDPTCGSGSFLLGAYQHLLDWHRDWYSANDPEKHAKGRSPKVYRGPGGGWRLTTAERKRILLNNVYGVDIDPQAVEVTKLSLLLKVLEEESGETLGRNWEMFHERALPDLDGNIKCGNSLIGPDYFEGKLDLDDEERRRINPFDWEAEFPDILKPKGAKGSAGFDAVIGNPPYIRMEAFKELKPYLQEQYATHAERADIFFYFVEKGASLLQNRGCLSFILSNTFTRSASGASLRRFICNRFHIRRLVEFGDFLPFERATVYPIIVVLDRSNGEPQQGHVEFVLQEQEPLAAEAGFKITAELERSRFGEDEWTFEKGSTRRLRQQLLSRFSPLKSVYGTVNMGIKTGLNEAFVIGEAVRKDIIERNKRAAEIIKPYLGGRHLDRWRAESEGLYLIYTPHGINMKPYPAVLRHLEPFKQALLQRATKQEWYELQQPQQAYKQHFEASKIIYPDMSRYPKFSLDTSGSYFSNTVYFIPSDSLFLLGLLNSRLLWFVIKGLSNALRGGLWRFRLFSGHIERLPVPASTALSSKVDRARHDEIVNLVERMLDLHRQLAAAKTPHDKTALQRQIDATDGQIDRLVYELYGLTEDEIRIVEDASTAPAQSADDAVPEARREGMEQYHDAFKRLADS